MNQTVTFVRPREPRSHATTTQTASNGQWEVKYVRTPADARAAFGRHQRETGHTHSFEANSEPSTHAVVRLAVCCGEDGCKQGWVAPLN